MPNTGIPPGDADKTTKEEDDFGNHTLSGYNTKGIQNNKNPEQEKKYEQGTFIPEKQ